VSKMTLVLDAAEIPADRNSLSIQYVYTANTSDER
jgi:hypothetical protein